MMSKPEFWQSYLQEAWSKIAIDYSPPFYKPTLLLEEPGNGADFLALALVAGQACSSASKALGCLECSVCLQVLSQSNPDVLVFGFDQPLKLETADQIQEHLQISSGRKSQDAVPRTVLIEGIDRMNDAGVNRLLKVFEEPPKNTWILATAVSEDAILETFLSRLTCLQLPSVPQEVLKDEYSGLNAFAYKYANGSYGRAALWQAFDQNGLWQDMHLLVRGGTVEARFGAAEHIHKKIKPAKTSAKNSCQLPDWFQQSDFWHALDVQLSSEADGDYKRLYMQRKLLNQYKKCTVPYNFRLALDAIATC